MSFRTPRHYCLFPTILLSFRTSHHLRLSPTILISIAPSHHYRFFLMIPTSPREKVSSAHPYSQRIAPRTSRAMSNSRHSRRTTGRENVAPIHPPLRHSTAPSLSVPSRPHTPCESPANTPPKTPIHYEKHVVRPASRPIFGPRKRKLREPLFPLPREPPANTSLPPNHHHDHRTQHNFVASRRTVQDPQLPRLLAAQDPSPPPSRATAGMSATTAPRFGDRVHTEEIWSPPTLN